MTYWRTSRATSGGVRQSPGSHYAQVTQRDLKIPAGSILPSGSSLERSNISQALIDVGFVLFAFLFVSITALSVVGAFFLLLFAKF